MKKLHVLGLAVSAALCVPMAAQAYDGTITFAGAIDDATCIIKVNGTTGPVHDVTLPTIAVNSIKGVSTVAGATPFSISISGCTTSSLIGPVSRFTAYFESSANVDLASGRLNFDGSVLPAATGVQFELLNRDGNVIDLRKESTFQGVIDSTDPTITLSDSVSNFIVRYYGTSNTPTAGFANSSITYSLNYF